MQIRTNFLFAIFLLTFIACQTPSSQNEIPAQVKNGELMVHFTEPTDEVERLLRLSGNEYVGDFELNFSSDKSHYFMFWVILDLMKTPRILGIEFYDQCFIYEMTMDSINDHEFYSENKHYSLLFDHRASDLMQNDSVYFSNYGTDIKTLPLEGKITGFRFPQSQFNYNTRFPAPLFTADFKPKGHESTDYEYIKAVYGFCSYDCTKEYDWKAIFESPEFKTRVLDTQSSQYTLTADLNEYLVIEEDLK